MQCEFLVKADNEGKRAGMRPCGKAAKYFAVRGGIAETGIRLCFEHERFCAAEYHWELKQLPAPEVEAR